MKHTKDHWKKIKSKIVIYNRASDGSKLIDDGNIFEIKGWGE